MWTSLYSSFHVVADHEPTIRPRYAIEEFRIGFRSDAEMEMKKKTKDE